MLEAVTAKSMSAKAAATWVAELEAPTHRLQIVDGAQRRPGEESLARPGAVILRPLLEPLFVHGIGLGGEDDLAAGAEILQRRQGDLGNLGTRVGEQSYRGVDRLDLLGIAGDVPSEEMADDSDPQAFDVLPQRRRGTGRASDRP